jgi:hypothetical protein
MKSLVLIVPEANRAAGDGVSVAMGYADPGASTYTVPLSATGQEPATHYGCHTAATDGFAMMVQILTSGVVPDGTSEALAQTALGLRAQQPALASGLIWSAEDNLEGWEHFVAVLSSHSLLRILDAN